MKGTLLLIVSSGIAFLFNMLLIPLLINLAHRFNWYDDIDHRKIHTGKIPRIGGIGIFLSFLAGITIFFILSPDLLFTSIPILTGFIIITILGLIDDFSSLRPRYKLIFQLAAAILVVSGGFHLETFLIPLSGTEINLGPLSWFLSILWIVGMCNAINLVDGLDGLAGGIVSIASFFTGIMAIYQKDPAPSLSWSIIFRLQNSLLEIREVSL